MTVGGGCLGLVIDDGVAYPDTVVQFGAWFPDDAACLDYLTWLRWSSVRRGWPWLAARRRRQLGVRTLRLPHQRDGGHDLPSHPYPVDGLVPRGLGADNASERGLCRWDP